MPKVREAALFKQVLFVAGMLATGSAGAASWLYIFPVKATSQATLSATSKALAHASAQHHEPVRGGKRFSSDDGDETRQESSHIFEQRDTSSEDIQTINLPADISKWDVSGCTALNRLNENTSFMIMLDQGSAEKTFSFVFITNNTIRKAFTYSTEPVTISYIHQGDTLDESTVAYSHVRQGNYMILHAPASYLDTLGSSTMVRFSNLTKGVPTTEFNEAQFSSIVSKLKEGCSSWGKSF